MMSCDTNILFSALDSTSAHHVPARSFLERMSDAEKFGLCELVLVELYGLLRNPVVSRRACSASHAAQVVQRLRAHPRWAVFDYPGPQAQIMDHLWILAADASFPYRRIYDTRLALTLRYHGVTEFATRNIRDFQGFGFKKVWDPTEA